MRGNQLAVGNPTLQDSNRQIPWILLSSKPQGWRWIQALHVARGNQFPMSILVLCPTIAAGIQFCLLCCQPGPMLRFVTAITARTPLLTTGCPCRPTAALGKSIYMVCDKAFKIPLSSITPDQCCRQCPSEEAMCGCKA